MKKEIKTLTSIAMSAVWHSKRNTERADKYTEELLSEVGCGKEGRIFAGIYSIAMRPYSKYFE